MPFRDNEWRIYATVALESPSVRRGLRLSASQAEQMESILRKTGETRKELAKVAEAPRSSRDAAEAKLLATYEEGDNAADGLLTNAQKERLWQLRSFWIMPEFSCLGDGACSDLNLSAGQKRMIDAMIPDLLEEQLRVPDVNPGPKKTIVQRGEVVEPPSDPMAALRRKFRDRFLGILTTDQAALLGAEFEINVTELPAIMNSARGD